MIEADRDKIIGTTEHFYSNLYIPKLQTPATQENNKLPNVGSEEIPDISEDEIINALSKIIWKIVKRLGMIKFW